MYINSNSMWGGPFGGVPYTISLLFSNQQFTEKGFQMSYINPDLLGFNALLQDAIDRGDAIVLTILTDDRQRLSIVRKESNDAAE